MPRAHPRHRSPAKHLWDCRQEEAPHGGMLHTTTRTTIAVAAPAEARAEALGLTAPAAMAAPEEEVDQQGGGQGIASVHDAAHGRVGRPTVSAPRQG